MIAKSGYIPARVTFFCREKQSRLNNRLATPAFPVADMTIQRKLKTVDNAKRWARWNRSVGYGAPGQEPKAGESLEIENKPQGGYRLVGAEQRAEGGRAWKVITPEGMLVDLREDVFLPILLTKGLPASGIIPGKFQWCQNGSQLRLELVGSKAHGNYFPSWDASQEEKKAHAKAAAKKRSSAPRVSARDLIVGRAYDHSMHGGNEIRLFLGRVRDPTTKKKLFAWLITTGCTSSHQAFHARWKEFAKYNWKHTVMVTASCSAKRLRAGPKLKMPEDWRKHVLWKTGNYDPIPNPEKWELE